MPFDLGPGATLWIALVILVASWVRGFSGFGFAAILVSGAALVTDPFHFVPVVILADILLTGWQLREIWPHVDRMRVLSLCAGALIGVPIGVAAMADLGVDTGRAILSAFILAMCALLLAGLRLLRPAGPLAHSGVGIVSGLANGAAVGGLPVAAFFAAQPIEAARFRATLIAYFTLLDLWTVPNMARAGMIGRDTFLATAMGLPLMVVGLVLGSRRFLKVAPQDFRRFAIFLLASLASLGLLKALA